MQRQTKAALVLACATTGLSWPVVLAAALLEVALRPDGKDAAVRGSTMATEITVIGVGLLCAAIWRRLPESRTRWATLGTLGGVVLSVFWLASGELYRSGRDAFFATLIGGLFFAGPIGALVGAACGAVLGVAAGSADRWDRSDHTGRAVALLFGVSAFQMLVAFGLGSVLGVKWWATNLIDTLVGQ